MLKLNEYDLEQVIELQGEPVLTNCYKNTYSNEDGTTNEMRIHGLITLNCKLKGV